MSAAARALKIRIAEALRGFGLLETPNAGPAPARVVEAYGQTIDDDEDQWRKLTGDADRDLSALTQTRMQKLALYVWESNLLANRIIELPLAYLLAEGVKLQVGDDDAQRWIDAFWRDPINAMDRKLYKKVRELALFGEQCWPAFTNPHSGHVRLGYLDPSLIETVVTDPDNAEQPIGIVTTKDKRGEARRYRIIINGPESVFTQRTQGIRESFQDGECFFYTVNDLSNGRRGRSDLLAQLDWLDGYEQFLFGELDRSQFLRAFMWDVTMTGATEEQVKARARQITAPKPGGVRVHNDAETWKAETPSLNGADNQETARLFRNHMLGGATIPEHWYGGGGDVNRAAGESMGEPTFKIFSSRQMYIKYILEDLALFQINRRLDPSGRQYLEPIDLDDYLMPEAVFPELTARDTTKYASALQQVTVAAVMAIDRGLITETLALEQIAAVSGRLGVDFDAAEELAAARKEAMDRQARDGYTDDPARVDEEVPGPAPDEEPPA